MVTPEASVKLHRIKNDQLYHYYLGDPIELLMLHADGSHTLVAFGPDVRAGPRSLAETSSYPQRPSWRAPCR